MDKQIFYNRIIDKKELKSIIYLTFESYNIAKATKLVENFKKSGFYFATKAGISIGLEDLKVPPVKSPMVEKNNAEIKLTCWYEKRGNINEAERFQKVIDTWQTTSDILKDQLVEFLKATDPLNPVYMMTFSGARGNLAQVRQLIGMRGLMTAPNGQVIDMPIQANFREGLTVTDYVISAYGARKGIVDTALKTADSGYLTRRLVDVAQHVIVRELDCKTKNGIQCTYNPEQTRLENFIGRVLAKPIFNKNKSRILVNSGLALTADQINKINFRTDTILRSPLICESSYSICQKCYGWNLAQSKLVELADAIGVIAAQSIGEPGTQLTMRTFHTGGVFTGETTNQIRSRFDGKILFPETLEIDILRTIYGDIVLKTPKRGHLFILVSKSRLLKIPLFNNMLIYVRNNSFIRKGGLIIEIPNTSRQVRIQRRNVTSNSSGEIQFQSLKSDSRKISVNSGLIWLSTGHVYDIRPNMAIKTPDSHIIKNNSFAQTKITAPLNGLVKIVKTRSSPQLLLINYFKVFPFKYLCQKNKDIILTINQNYRFKLLPKLNNIDVGIRKTKKYRLPIPYKIYRSKLYSVCDRPITILNPTHSTNFLFKSESYVLLEETTQNNVFSNLINGYLIFSGEIINSITNTQLKHCKLFRFSNNKSLILFNPLAQCIVAKKLNAPFSKTYRGKSLLNNDISFVTQFKYRDGICINKNNSFLQTSLTFLFLSTAIEPKLARRQFSATKPGKNLFGYFLTYKLPINIPSQKSKTFFKKTILVYHVAKNQYVDLYSIIATINSTVNQQIKIKSIKTLKQIPTRSLITTTANYTNYKSATPISSKFIVVGDEISPNKFSNYSGYNTSFNRRNRKKVGLTIQLRLSIPFFISVGTQIFVQHGSLIHAGETLCQLFYNRIINDDIIRGLPRVEKVFEARGSKDQTQLIESPGVIRYKYSNNRILVLEKRLQRTYEHDPDISFECGEMVFVGQPIENDTLNPHSVLATYFKYYCSFYTAKRAALLSITNIQILLLNLIQDVYIAQGVDIADKHIEVIIRQITSKVKILQFNIDTFFIPTEYMEFDQVIYINSALKFAQKPLIEYQPILLGITKVSLMTESFVSAASFQSTTRVLTQAAVEGRIEWLRGLKENVILGRLIPAGTGFKSFNSTSLMNVRLNS